MAIGLSTYAYLWRMADSAEPPMTLLDVVREAAELSVPLVQICDYPSIDSYSDDDLRDLKRSADAFGVRFELGTRGVDPTHLAKYLELAAKLDVSFVRSMLGEMGTAAARDQAVASLQAALPAFAARGVSIGLETYEQVATHDLMSVVEKVDSPHLGVCLDPANSVARLEHPRDVIEAVADRVLNIHVKDFRFTRQQGLVGFTLAGCPLGEGMLDYDGMIERVRPDARGVNQIIEHWLPWQGSAAETALLEDEWTRKNVAVLRSKA